jgi:hypothetical protein
LTPSAIVCSQPNFPPTRVGPSRSWIRPAAFRSTQMKKIADAATKLIKTLAWATATNTDATVGPTPKICSTQSLT